MKTRVAALVLALALSGGCASGGGSGGSGSSSSSSDLPPLICAFAPWLCLLKMYEDAFGDGIAETSAGEYRAVVFSSWREGKGKAVAAWGVPGDVTESGAVLEYDANGRPVRFVTQNASFSADSGTGTLAALGQPGIDRYEDAAIVANPYALGWNYQTFGAWNEQRADGTSAVVAGSFGNPTPASAVPSAGTATFTGKMAGFHVSSAGAQSVVASELTVNADFSTRSLGLATSGTRLGGVAAPHLDLRGTLTYASGTSAFSGTVTSAGGTLSGASRGQFYGPAAQELGGSFELRSATSGERFTGAYGAKR